MGDGFESHSEFEPIAIQDALNLDDRPRDGLAGALIASAGIAGAGMSATGGGPAGEACQDGLIKIESGGPQRRGIGSSIIQIPG